MRLDCISESNEMLLFLSFHDVILCYSNQKGKKTKQRPALKQLINNETYAICLYVGPLSFSRIVEITGKEQRRFHTK